MTPRATRDRALLVAALVGSAVCVTEIVLLLKGARGGGWWLLVGGHGLLAAVLSVWAWHPAQRSSRHVTLLWLGTVALGPLGAGGALLAMALEWHYARRATGLEEWHAMLFPPSRVDEQAELWRRIGQRASDRADEQSVTPFLDVLAFGSVVQRQSVIAIIVQQFNPVFAPALKAALRDEHNVIRVQAATGIARLENEFLERTMALEAALRAAPADAAAMLALATHYDNQAFAGLLDATREEECRVKAAEGYAQYLACQPVDHAVMFRLARLQQRRGLWQDAERLFRYLAERGYPGARHWLMEALFVQRRFADVRAVAASRPSDPDDSVTAEVAESLALWSGREAA